MTKLEFISMIACYLFAKKEETVALIRGKPALLRFGFSCSDNVRTHDEKRAVEIKRSLFVSLFTLLCVSI